MPPDLAQQLDPRRHRAAAPHERQEQVELLGTQRHQLALLRHGARCRIDLDHAELLDRVGRRGVRGPIGHS